jgi:NAD-dependent SIR2 family protein deacetylase
MEAVLQQAAESPATSEALRAMAFFPEQKASFPEHNESELQRLLELLRGKRVFVLTGAGCSTESGIPDYRDVNGEWKHKQPIQLKEFTGSHFVRQRYWARSAMGWQRFRDAQPNLAHWALAALENLGVVHSLLTQNVDGLHQRAGSRRVIDLHGRLDTVECLACRHRNSRDEFQSRLLERNPNFRATRVETAPDGDVELHGVDYAEFDVPACHRCGGVLKPAVIFFGETVPAERVELAYRQLFESDALLVIGSSLMVFSGFRFVRAAAAHGIPIALINRGRSRADAFAQVRVDANCSDILPRLVPSLSAAR